MSISTNQYIKLLRTLPKDVILKKGFAKIGRILRHNWDKTSVRLFGANISDKAFWAALAPPVANEQALGKAMRKAHLLPFGQPGWQAESAAAVRTQFPATAQATLLAADQTLRHTFDLLGSGLVDLGPKINWQADFKTGHVYDPQAHYTEIKPASYPGGHDIKVPWELSRCQHLVWLGQAYALTADEKYTQEFIAQVSDWIQSNPPKLGVNWVCTMDVAIRAVNWLWALQFFYGSPLLTDKFLIKLAKSLLVHGRHILANLEWSPELTGNHYLSDIVGLVYLGLLCPYFEESDHWRKFGLQELWREMEKQVYWDGADFEASISYHRLAAELFLAPIVLCRQNEIEVPPLVLARLEKMLEYIQHYTRPDGTVPLIGDSDNGRLHRLKVWPEPSREWIDHRYLLAIAAPLFNRTDFARAAGDQWEEAYWIWGRQAVQFRSQVEGNLQPAQVSASRAFPQAGIYVLRHNDIAVVVDAGPNGQNGNGGHAHNDTLSFDFYAQGRAWIVDPGTYLYTADYVARNEHRSSKSHNCLQLGALEINRIDERLLFTLSDDAQPTIHHWRSFDEADVLRASHNGYERLSLAAQYHRYFYLDKILDVLFVQDRVELGSASPFTVSFQLKLATVELNGNVAWVTNGQSGIAICVLCTGAEVRFETGSGWISESYGSRYPAPVLAIVGEATGSFNLAFSITPFETSSRPDPSKLDESLKRHLIAYE